jgi:uncharacterized protein YjiK
MLEHDILEPSGISFHPSRMTLFVVSDEGQIVEIDRDGTIISTFEITGDLEGVTVDPDSGLVYVLSEGVDSILEFDPEQGKVIREFSINRGFRGDPNFLQKQTTEFDNGCESIAFVPDQEHPEGGAFFVANQWDPSCIVELNVPIRSSSPSREAYIVRVLPFRIDDPAAMYFDAETGFLNVVSDADNILVELTLGGALVREYAFLGDNQEGVTKDGEGFLYIAQDNGGIVKVKDLR